MKHTVLYESMNEIDDELLERSESAKQPRRKVIHLRWIAAAACFCLIAGLGFLGVRLFGPGVPPAQSLSAGGGGRAVAEARYPEMAQFPREEEYWNEAENCLDLERYLQAEQECSESRWKQLEQLPEQSAEALLPFFEASARQFLAGEGENPVISPVNLYLSLALLAEVTDGNSRQQILDLIGADGIETLRRQASGVWNAHYRDDGVTSSIPANSLWLREGVEYDPATVETLAGQYYASTFQGSMGSEEYNALLRQWINEQTHGLLEQQTESLTLDPNNVAALVSTLYFKEKWEDPFSEDNTWEEPFHRTDGQELPCDFMHLSRRTNLFWGDHFTAVCLRFESMGYMTLILPDEGFSPEALLADEQAMEFLLRGPENAPCRFLQVNLSLPKFDVSSDLDLVQGLQTLGVSDVFDPAASDFTPLTAAVEQIELGSAEHAARVKVDEEGCEAAAYTSYQIAATSALEEDIEEIDLVLDRPFLFSVIGTSNMPLFTGVVDRPVE